MSANFTKAFACAIVAVVLTTAASWTFVDSTSIVRVNDFAASTTQLAATVASALVR
ncbi:MAG TPA: hypothetical protein P5528_02790 [Steroidobacteraceae bacterium]|nr:hypothetical protein [Steroidobacteraceae bacterium]HRX88350.1 hypothetical protein [Steroidobacteraceae bacterium]